MMRPEKTSYTPLDLLAFRESESLVLAPKFQRRAVWKTPAKSYFIDTLIRGLPVPPIYIRVTQAPDRKRTIREVIDGQQRLSAVLDYVDGKFALTRTLASPFAGKTFGELPDDAQDTINSYGLYCEVFHGISDAEVLEIFARLNTFSVRLNAQELRNGTYFGLFKQLAYALAHEHVEFWRRQRIFTDGAIARMDEVELTSELLVAQLDGMQDKKTSLNRFYADCDEELPDRAKLADRFRATLDMIVNSVGSALPASEFRRRPLFYSLFCVVYHRAYGLPNGAGSESAKGPLGKVDQRGLSEAVLHLSDILAAARVQEDDDSERPQLPERYARFVTACLQQTDNIAPRRIRFEELYTRAFG